VTTFDSPSTKPADPRSLLARGITLFSVLITAALGLLALAGPAAAIVTEVGATTVGLQPRSVEEPVPGSNAGSFSNAAGNPVLHGSSVYVLYWDPADRYHGDWQTHIDEFMQAIGAESGGLGNVFSVGTQYTDKTNVPSTYGITFRGAYTDTTPYPTSGCSDPSRPAALACLTDAQIQEQLQSYIASHGLPKGMGVVYYLLTPPPVSVCLDAAATHCSDYKRSAKEEGEGVFASPSYENSLCSYHSAINPGGLPTGDGNTILYAAVPWTATTLKGAPSYECQDGGYDPSSKVPEEREEAKQHTKKEEEEFKEDTPKQKEEIEAAERREGPHAEEPNQSGVGPDGTYDTALSDLIINQIAVEQQDVASDPLLNGWQDSARNEASDECRNWFAIPHLNGSVSPDEHTLTGTLSNQTIGGRGYYLQTAFNFAAYWLSYPGVRCLPGVSLVPNFTSPNTVNVGDVVGFDGMESDIALNGNTNFLSGVPQPHYATYSWNFGDGTPVVSGFAPGAPLCEAPWLTPCAASVFHAYAAGGAYQVTLTVTDVGGNVASTTRGVVVMGPAPTPSVPGTNSGGSTTGSTPGSSPGSTGGAPGVILRPVAQAVSLSHSLRTALKKGLSVRFSVNEQVAGRFEVLISRTLAKRLKLGGAPATGLPAGTPPQLMIAKATLITTKGGQGTMQIKFSKAVAKRLAHAGKVSLLLRLIVRNASKSPISTTVLSSITLN
jgi:hypothetical protein